ncbi:MAG TPA: hypothetical protein VF018_17820, partial [Acidobacteriaceae bacterium]
MSRLIPNPNEVEELEDQLRHALRREAAPASLAPAVEARMHTPAVARPAAFEPHLFNPVVDEPVWRTWLGTVRGLFVRENLPPLVLTSHPVAVPDPF